MAKRLSYLTITILALGLAGDASAALVAHWPFNNSPNDQVGALHWTLNGGATYSTDRKEGSASLLCDGKDDYASLAGSGLMSAVFTTKTVMLQFKANATAGTQVIYDEGGTTQGLCLRLNNGALEAAVRASSAGSTLSTPLSKTGWSHVAVSFNNGAFKLYLNGKEAGSATAAFTSVPSHTNAAGLGARNGQDAFGTTGTGDYYGGLIDDVRMYDQALTAAEIQRLAGSTSSAGNVSPTAGATDVPRDATLNWTAGETAGTHDVYLGTTFADVNTAGRTDAKGVLVAQGQAEITFDPPGLLAYGQTYYWRIDEVNKAPDNTIFKGEVWSFAVEPYGYPIKPVAATASSSQVGMGPEKTIDGSGLTGDLHGTVETTMWLSAGVPPNWIQYELDQVYKLHQLMVWNSNQLIESFLGFGAKQVTIESSTDGTTWTPVAKVPEFARGSGASGYAANTTVSLGGAQAKYVKLTINASWGGMPTTGLSEVRFSYVPTQARVPQPASAAAGVSIDTSFKWRPGREAASHQVYFGTDPNAVAQGTAPAKTVSDHSFAPGVLNLGTTYYWRVDEVNAVTYPGDVWSFTTETYKVVDDFESYTDQAGAEIFSTWIDGFADNYKSSGSTVGLNTAVNGTFGETTIIHGGKQSMPLAYDNSKAPTYSEATWTFDTPQDWTASGIKSLSLWFQGVAGNGGQLYVKINGTKVLYDGDAADLARAAWQVWNIDLSQAGKVNSVRSLTIGVEGAAAKGTLYVDDVRLYPKTPGYVTPVPPAATNLVAYYTFDEGSGAKAGDSSGKGNNGTASGNPQWVAGKIGGALSFDGVDDFVDCGKGAALVVRDTITVACWIKVASFTRNWETILAMGDDSYRLSRSATTGNSVHFGCNGPTGGNLDAKTLVTTDTWRHVALVYDGINKIVYVDGIEDARVASTGQINASAYNLYIGANAQQTGRNLKGLVDDVRIYSRPLSADEVAGLAGLTQPRHKSF